MNRINLLILICALHLLTAKANAGPLELETYISQVKDKHSGIEASKETMESTRLKKEEVGLAFSPNAFATISHTDDKGPIANQATKANKTLTDTLSVGVKQNFRIGTNATISYNVNKMEYEGANPKLLPEDSFYIEKPTVELRQPLWRNSLGRENKATEEAAKARLESSFYAERFKLRSTLLEAENAYWRLAFTRRLVQIQKENLDRAIKLKEWSASRVKKQLADEADLIQAEAMTSVRNLELESSQDDERAAARTFNSFRGLDSDVVSEALTELKPEIAASQKKINRQDQRDDVLSAHYLKEASASSAILSEEKYKPSLDVFGSYAINGKNPKASNIPPESYQPDQPTWTVGLTFSTPLDFGIIRQTTEAYKMEALAAEKNYERKKFEQMQEWQNLQRKLDEAQKRLILAGEVEKIQKTKLDYERDRQQRGRSTFYQVLSFEQDYASAQQSKLSRLNEVIQIRTQMKAFAEEY